MDFSVEFYETVAGNGQSKSFWTNLRQLILVILRRSWPDWLNYLTVAIMPSRFQKHWAMGYLNCAMSANLIPESFGSL